MRALTAIGEMGFEGEDGEFLLLRPSFRAVGSLGTPDEIVALFQSLHTPPRLMTFDDDVPPGLVILGNEINRKRIRDHWRQTLFDSLRVVEACVVTGRMELFFGTYGERYEAFRPGPIPLDAVVIIARRLLISGMIGPLPKVKPDPDSERDKGKYTPGFNALAWASKAMAHLGVSEDAAWNMTMLGFAAAWEAKFGEHKESRYIQEHQGTMDWLKKVNEARAPKNV